MKAAAVVLLINGGGFIGGHYADPHPLASEFRDAGMPAISVKFRRDDPRHGLADIRAAMRRQLRRGRRVYVFGHSSGGAFALRLAETGRPSAVVALSPVADVTDWRANVLPDWTGSFAVQIRKALTPRVVRVLDPMRHSCRHMSVTYMAAGNRDELVPMAGAQRFARRCKRAHMHVTGDDHLSILNHPHPAWMRWLKARMRRDARPRR